MDLTADLCGALKPVDERYLVAVAAPDEMGSGLHAVEAYGNAPQFSAIFGLFHQLACAPANSERTSPPDRPALAAGSEESAKRPAAGLDLEFQWGFEIEACWLHCEIGDARSLDPMQSFPCLRLERL